MMGRLKELLSPYLLLQLLIILPAATVNGGYLITTPRRWISERPTQLCVSVKGPTSAPGYLNVTVVDDNFHTSSELKELNGTGFLFKTIDIPGGPSDNCHEIQVPATSDYRKYIRLDGLIGGSNLTHRADLVFKTFDSKTFLQADKYLYKPGQKVQFRALTVVGPDMKVSTEEYPEVWVTSPSRTRIAQWKNVTTASGLVHLDFQLTDEPEEGSYRIHLRPPKGHKVTANFKVEDFVLPRFEVTIQPPSFILATDTSFTFKVCANYTFGEPVRGNLSATIDNNQSKKCRVRITRNTTIVGCTEVEASIAEMQVTDCNVYSVSLKALFIEEGTGVEEEKSSSKSIDRTAVRFKTIYKDDYMKPNLPYTIKVRAERPDGSVAVGVPVEVCAAGQCTNLTTTSTGLVTAVLPNYHSFGVKLLALNCRVDMDPSKFSETLEHYFSPSSSSLLIHTPEERLPCSGSAGSATHSLKVLFSAKDQPSALITVQVVSRGSIQYSNTQEYQLLPAPLPINSEHLVEPLTEPTDGTVRGVIDVKVNLPQQASPKAQVLVWYTRSDGEVVSDSRELEVEKCLPLNVTMKWSTQRAQPGDAASVTLTSEPDSVCSLGVVDRSSELLTPDPDPINIGRLFSFVETFNIGRHLSSQIDDYRYCEAKNPPKQNAAGEIILEPRYYYYSDYVDAIKMFDIAGLYVFTDYTVETRPCEKEDHGIFPAFGGGGPFLEDGIAFAAPAPVPVAARPPLASSSPDREGVDGGSSVSEAPRTDFPETWLWDLVTIPSSGVSEQTVTLPDTITQWVGKAVCTHTNQGVGVSDKSTITAFTPFFVDLTLPPKMKRGEILPVVMSIFNYLDQPLPVSVILEDSPEYEILQESGADISPVVRGKRSACVPPQDKKVLTVRIKPTVIADVNITVSAAVDQSADSTCAGLTTLPQKRDALIKPIRVEAEGFLRENSWSKYICSKDFETGEDSLEAWQLTLPTVLVEGSARGWVTAVGDLLALTLENLGSLIRMPYGCGEQNMINFAPNIFILRYLETTKQTTPEAKTKLINYMTTGYRRELLYRRNDASYSAFGNADDSGSTWLTAFVFKSFEQAREFIQVDADQLNETSSWLFKQQAPDGCFISVGKLLHKDMQGGVSSANPVSLTAYVMSALLEGGIDPSDKRVSDAAQCILSDTSIHPYTLATKAYALALANHTNAGTVLQSLLDQAVVKKNAMYWNLPRGRSGNSRAASIETAGYAILAMMTHDPINMEPQARKIVKWITAQRNGQGGFYSTQDTVVALQAMATYESHLHQGPLNVQAIVTADNFTHSFTVTESNKLLEQLQTLPVMPTTVSINMTGQGCAVLQAVQRYNIPEPEATDAFALTVNTITVPDKLCVTKRITACASYRLSDQKSNMAVIEVDLISGYIPDKQDLKQLLKDDRNIKRYEVDGSKVNFYIDELTSTDTCVNFKVIREVTVEEVKAGTVIVYDYYQPEFSISRRYTLPPPEECR